MRRRGGGRRWLWGLGALAAAVLTAGLYLWPYGLLPAGTVFGRLGQRVDAAKTIYMEYTQSLGDSAAVRAALAIEKPDHVWTAMPSQTLGTVEWMSDGKNTYGHFQSGQVYWMEPSAEFAQTMIRSTLANLGAPSALRASGVKKVQVRKTRVVQIKGQRAYALNVDMDGAKGTLFISARSLLPLRASVPTEAGTQTIDYELFALDQPLPQKVRFSPPKGATLGNLEAALEETNVAEPAR